MRFRPREEGFVEDPYPTYAALRHADPIHRGPMGAWVLTRYDDVQVALANARLSNGLAPQSVLHQKRGRVCLSSEVAGNILPFMDGERHAALRRIVTTTMRGALKQRPPDIAAAVDRLLAPHLVTGEIDLLHDFARPLSVEVICEFMGFPITDAERLARWTGEFLRIFHPIPSFRVLEKMDEALFEFRRYLADNMEARERDPREDLTSMLAQAMRNLGAYERTAVLDNCMLLFADAVENVDAAISNALSVLLRHPEQLELLRARPDLADTAVEECLRFEPANQFIGRVAGENLSLHGREIREGSVVLLVLASANRDPAHFADPDRFDVTRTDNPHLSLGMGRHFCVGAKLVRMEMVVALDTVARRLPGLAGRDAALRWQARLGHRWLEALPVTFTPLRSEAPLDAATGPRLARAASVD